MFCQYSRVAEIDFHTVRYVYSKCKTLPGQSLFTQINDIPVTVVPPSLTSINTVHRQLHSQSLHSLTSKHQLFSLACVVSVHAQNVAAWISIFAS